MTPKQIARVRSTTERAIDVIGSEADKEKIKSAITAYIEMLPEVDRKRRLSYSELRFPDIPFPMRLKFQTRTDEQRDAARELERALLTLDTALSNKYLPYILDLRVRFPTDFEDKIISRRAYNEWMGRWKDRAHIQATKKFSEKEIPKDPVKIYSASCAEYLLVLHRMLRFPGPNSKFVRLATAIHFNEPIQKPNCGLMRKACEAMWKRGAGRARPEQRNK
jgi:hypothetical protein